MAGDVCAALRQVPLFADLADDELAWIVAQGAEVWLQPGDVHRHAGDPAEHVFVLFDGELRVVQQVNDEERTLVTYGPHTLFGELPILLGIDTFFASGRAVRPCHILELPNAVFGEMLTRFPAVGVGVLRIMAQRIRELEARGQGRARMATLARLGEGLAQEGLGPTQAAHTAAHRLRVAQATVRDATVSLLASGALPAATLATISREYRTRLRSVSAPAEGPSVEVDQVQAWLAANGVDEKADRVAAFVAAGLDVAWLESLAARVPPDCLEAVIHWLHTLYTLHTLLATIEQNATSISALVDTVKTYTYLDQAPRQRIDLHDGIESTLLILSAALRAKAITVQRQYDRSLPQIEAYGRELNQVWTTLLDNAIAAVDHQGMITIRTRRAADHILVEVVDDGPGIPQNQQTRLWEPRYTTSDVGQGTGLGLMQSYRIVVGRHKGAMHVESQPGNTCFRVTLPVG